MGPYGEFDTVMAAVVGALLPGPYLLGERFSAADVLWGTALGWTTRFKLVPEAPEIMEYIRRVGSRPRRARAGAGRGAGGGLTESGRDGSPPAAAGCWTSGAGPVHPV